MASVEFTVQKARFRGNFSRVDIEFYGISSAGPSYEGRVFLDEPDADGATTRESAGFVGSFFVFGKAGCWGEEDHCTPPTARRRFDKRLPHPMTPDRTRVSVPAEQFRRIVEESSSEELTISVVAVVPRTADYDRFDDTEVFDAERVSIVTYR